MPFPRIATAATIGWLTVTAGAAATAQSTAETVEGNDNRRPAGSLADGALTVRIYAARGDWRPERDEGPALNVAAFGEDGGPLVTPGPLLRVAEGTDVIVSVRNTLAERLSIHGLVRRPAAEDAVFTVEPGQTREIRFPANTPGTYHYWATTAGSALNRRQAVESQLGGAFIVDPRGSVANDRVLVMTQWDDSQLLVDEIVDARSRRVFAINGRSWPHTERLDEQVGRTANWHIVNLTQVSHPMHLHGFYFSVRSIGTGLRQTTYAPDEYRTVVTEPVPAGRTVQLAWIPERPGNWLLHCHMIAHATPALRFWAPTPGPRPCDTRLARCHDRHGRPCDGHSRIRRQPGGPSSRRGAGTTAHARDASTSRTLASRGRIRLRARVRNECARAGRRFCPRAGSGPDAGRARGDSAEERTAGSDRDPLARDRARQLLRRRARLERGRCEHDAGNRAGRTLRRALHAATRRHFHLSHALARTLRQLASGLYGAIVVVDPGQAFDSTRDHVVVLGMEGTKDTLRYDRFPVVVNGRRDTVLTMKAGVPNRLRLDQHHHEF